MSTVPLFLELWAGVSTGISVSAVAVKKTVKANRRNPNIDPSDWVRAMDSYLDQRLQEEHWQSAEGTHICGAGCQRLGLTDDWRRDMGV